MKKGKKKSIYHNGDVLTKKAIKNKTKNLHNKAWALMSRYVRLRDGGTCYTCRKPFDYKDLQAGHFIHGRELDFISTNIHSQCIKCNHFLAGNIIEYYARMLIDYGQDEIDRLKSLKNKPLIYTLTDYENHIDYLKLLIAELEK